MNLSSNGRKLIQEFEGLSLVAYRDSVGVRTIGYGHAYWIGDNRITQEEAEELFNQDIYKFVQHVNGYMPQYNWNQNEFDAMVSFAFNLGSIQQLTQKGTRPKSDIPKYMVQYVNSGGKYVKGLHERRIKERDLFMTPVKEEKKSNTYIACEVIVGLWGNGTKRKEKLEAAGYDYAKIQSIVNKVLKING